MTEWYQPPLFGVECAFCHDTPDWCPPSRFVPQWLYPLDS